MAIGCIAIASTIVPMIATCQTPQAPIEPTLTLLINFVHSGSWNWSVPDPTVIAFSISGRLRKAIDIDRFRLALTSEFKLGANYRDDTASAGEVQVTDNAIASEIIVSCPMKWQVDPCVAVAIRTSITESFAYQPTARFRIAKLWDPVTTTESIGFTNLQRWQGGTWTNRLGIGLEQCRAEYNTTLTDEVRTPAVRERYKARSGIEMASELRDQFDSSVTIVSRLSVFGSFDDLSIWRARFDAEVLCRVWKALAVTWSIESVHDVQQSLRTQFRQRISIGIAQRW